MMSHQINQNIVKPYEFLYLLILPSEMDEDQFNDFEQAVQIPPEIQPENNQKYQEHVEEQTNLAEDKFTPIDPLLINPSSCLAAKSIEPPSGDIEIKDLEGSSQPHLSKIRSEKLATSEDVFLDLEPYIELIDYSNVNLIEEKNFFNEILADKVEDSTFQNLENTNQYQKVKIQNEIIFNENSQDAEHNLNWQQIQEGENVNYQSKVEESVKEKQQFEQNQERQSQKCNQQTVVVASNHQFENNQIKIQKQTQELHFQQTNQQKQTQKQQEQQDDQFGDFQQTVPNTEETNEIQVHNFQSITQNEEYRAEISKVQQPPQVMKKRTRKQQLEQFVNSLPDYSFLFVQSFQSF